MPAGQERGWYALQQQRLQCNGPWELAFQNNRWTGRISINQAIIQAANQSVNQHGLLGVGARLNGSDQMTNWTKEDERIATISLHSKSITYAELLRWRMKANTQTYKHNRCRRRPRSTTVLFLPQAPLLIAPTCFPLQIKVPLLREFIVHTLIHPIPCLPSFLERTKIALL